MSSASHRIKEAAEKKGFSLEVITFPQSTKSAKEAALALGVTPGQIGKSLLFMVGRDPLLCIGSGMNRVNEKRLFHKIEEEVRLAKAKEVRDLTGFSIGGVPPFGHLQPIKTLIDEDLMGYDTIYCAAGTPHTVFAVTPEKLLDLTGGEVMRLK